MPHSSDSFYLEADENTRPIIPENLKKRILDAYQSEALARSLEEGNEASLYILSQLVYMNFNPKRLLVLSQKSDFRTIARICKENLDGQSLLHELHRTLFSEVLH